MMKITTVRQASQLNGVKVLVYGEAGAGKTVLATTCEDPIIISAESGLLSASKVLKEANMDLPVLEISNVADLTEAFDYCSRGEGRNYKTICLDSITEIAEQILSNAKATSKDPRNAYGTLADKAVAIIKQFRDLAGRDVYFSCKMSAKDDAVIGGARFSPHMPGQSLKVDLPYLFDEVFYLGIGTDDKGTQFRFIRTQSDNQYIAKDRSGVLDVFEAPNLGYIINKIKTITS